MGGQIPSRADRRRACAPGIGAYLGERARANRRVNEARWPARREPARPGGRDVLPGLVRCRLSAKCAAVRRGAARDRDVSSFVSSVAVSPRNARRFPLDGCGDGRGSTTRRRSPFKTRHAHMTRSGGLYPCSRPPLLTYETTRPRTLVRALSLKAPRAAGARGTSGRVPRAALDRPRAPLEDQPSS